MKNTFMGYMRPDGQAGIRNRLLVLASVSCANDVVLKIAHNMSGTVAITHQHGCGHLLTEDILQTRRMLVNSACNPNIGACLVVGLGCELMEAHSLAEEIFNKSRKPAVAISIQGEGGTINATTKGRKICLDLLKSIHQERVLCDIHNLTIGIFGNYKEAFPDNYSIGGNLTDTLLENGISVIQAESAELYPLREVFLKRCEAILTRQKLSTIFKNIERKLATLGTTYNNLAINTNLLWEDIAKCKMAIMGKSNFSDVIPTGERCLTRGLVHMESTLFTPETISAMGASSAQLGIYLGKRVYGTHPVIPAFTLAKINCLEQMAPYLEQNDTELIQNNYSFAITRIGPST